MSQVSGNAWVYGNARVYGNAQVSGDARVYGDARVSGNACVYGNARVYGDAQVSGDACVYGDAQVSGDACVYGDADFFFVGPIGSRNDQLTVHADAKIGIRFTTGCFSGTELELSAAVTKTHKSSAYAKQYRAAMALALMVVKPKE